MMKALVLYYSLEGNVNFAAETLAGELGADLFRVRTVKEYPAKGFAKFFHGGKDAVFSATPELKEALPDFSPYDTIVLGAPVWAGKPAAPMNTILANADFTGKKIAVFVSSAGGNGDSSIKIISEKAKNASKVIAGLSLKNPGAHQEECKEQIKTFAEKIKLG